MTTKASAAAAAVPIDIADPRLSDEERGKRIVERYAAAKAEAAAVVAWKAKGEKGKRPVTPNYDAIQADAEAGRTRVRSNGGSGSGASRKTATVVFTIKGREIHRPDFSLARIAVEQTRGIGGPDVKRISVGELRKVLADLGVEDPENTEWEVTLPNGHVVGAVLPGNTKAETAAPEEGQKASTPRAKAAAKKNGATPRKRTAKAPAKKATAKKTTAKASKGKPDIIDVVATAVEEQVAKAKPAKASAKQVTPRFKGKK